MLPHLMAQDIDIEGGKCSVYEMFYIFIYRVLWQATAIDRRSTRPKRTIGRLAAWRSNALAVPCFGNRARVRSFAASSRREAGVDFGNDGGLFKQIVTVV